MRTPAAFLILALLPTLNAQQPPNSPNFYDCHKTTHPPKIDGKLDDPAWKSAPWTPDFIDIASPSSGIKPPFHTRAKLLWDDQYLYIAAELEEPDLHSTMTEHDTSLYKENNFEFFLKPFADQSGDRAGYFEFEINASKTTWDLYLPKPYSEGGKADSSWEITGLRQAVVLHGTLNNPKDHDHGWTVELAVPWTALATRLPVTPPTVGTEWRANLMRVEWPSKQSGSPPVSSQGNFSVWSPQGIPDMHAPERWGYLRFRGPS
jgi:Carbohydrate family 9 binding domain-like